MAAPYLFGTGADLTVSAHVTLKDKDRIPYSTPSSHKQHNAWLALFAVTRCTTCCAVIAIYRIHPCNAVVLTPFAICLKCKGASETQAALAG